LTHKQHAKSALFFKTSFGFFPWLASSFHNFLLTQNREKTRNGLLIKKKSYVTESTAEGLIADSQSLQNLFNAWLLDTNTDSEHLHLILPGKPPVGECCPLKAFTS
jgi:hypothetical protein